MNYFLHFIIGTSIFVYFHHLISVILIPNKSLNYSFNTYVFLAPIYFGFMNMFSIYLQNLFNLSTTQRFLLISVISATVVPISAYCLKAYNYTKKEWRKYIIKIVLLHLLDFNVILRSIEYLIKK